MQAGSIIEDAAILTMSSYNVCLVICPYNEEQVRFHGDKKILNLDVNLIKNSTVKVCGRHEEAGDLYIAFEKDGNLVSLSITNAEQI